jgi:hypothetical protein
VARRVDCAAFDESQIDWLNVDCGLCGVHGAASVAKRLRCCSAGLIYAGWKRQDTLQNGLSVAIGEAMLGSAIVEAVVFFTMRGRTVAGSTSTDLRDAVSIP